MEVLPWGEMVILRTLLRICGAGARVRINVQTDCHTHQPSDAYIELIHARMSVYTRCIAAHGYGVTACRLMERCGVEEKNNDKMSMA